MPQQTKKQKITKKGMVYATTTHMNQSRELCRHCSIFGEDHNIIIETEHNTTTDKTSILVVSCSKHGVLQDNR